jgi:hypothetical protein
MNQFDDAHVAGGSGERRGGRGIGQVWFRTVLVVVPAVVQSHPASVAQRPRPTASPRRCPRSREGGRKASAGHTSSVDHA